MKSTLLPALFALCPALLFAQAVPQPFTLKTGLRCVLVENHERPLVRMELRATWDPATEPSVRDGRLGFLAGLCESAGAGPNNRVEFIRAMDELGLALTFQARRGGFQWKAVADGRSLEPAFECLADAVFRPVLDGPGVEAQRQRLTRRVDTLTPQENAESRFQWGLRDPGALSVPGGGGLAQIELPDLTQLHRRLIRPENAILVLYGDLNLAQAKELAFLHFGVWGPGFVPVPPPASPTQEVPEPTFLAWLGPGAGTECWAGAMRTGSGGAGVDELLATLLTLDPRLSRPGLQLEATLEGEGPLLIKARVGAGSKENPVAALQGLLESLRTQGLSQEALTRAKVQWRARRTTLALHPEALLADLIQHGQSQAWESSVENVTVEDLNKALRAWLEPANLRYLLLGGDASLLKVAEASGWGTAVRVN